jgi:hypothetical protein
MSLLATNQAITVIQQAVTHSSPITVSIPDFISTTTKPWFEIYGPSIIGAIVSASVGALAAIYGARYGANRAKENDLQRRYLDLLVTRSQKRYELQLPQINALHMFVQAWELIFAEMEKSNVPPDMNMVWAFYIKADEYLREYVRLDTETIAYHSSEHLAYVRMIRREIEKLSELLPPGHKTPDEFVHIFSTNKEPLHRLVVLIEAIINKSAVLLSLETYQRAIEAIPTNNPTEFYRKLDENATELKTFLEKARPEIVELEKMQKVM